MNWRHILNAIGILLVVVHVVMLVVQWPTESLLRHFALLCFVGLLGFDRLTTSLVYKQRSEYWEDGLILLLLGVVIALSAWLELWRPLTLAAGMTLIVIGSIPKFRPVTTEKRNI